MNEGVGRAPTWMTKAINHLYMAAGQISQTAFMLALLSSQEMQVKSWMDIPFSLPEHAVDSKLLRILQKEIKQNVWKVPKHLYLLLG